MFISDAEKRALDLVREQLVRALPSWTILGASFNMSGPHFRICERGTTGRMNRENRPGFTGHQEVR